MGKFSGAWHHTLQDLVLTSFAYCSAPFRSHSVNFKEAENPKARQRGIFWYQQRSLIDIRDHCWLVPGPSFCGQFATFTNNKIINLSFTCPVTWCPAEYRLFFQTKFQSTQIHVFTEGIYTNTLQLLTDTYQFYPVIFFHPGSYTKSDSPIKVYGLS